MKKALVERLRTKPRAFFGHLAEEYDGVGQYVAVTLSRGATSVVAKAKVAAGDFGGSRKIPAGSRVTVFSIRGHLEVLLGNHPRDLCITDHFKRIVAGGGGVGPLGPWLNTSEMSAFYGFGTTPDPDHYSVDGEYLNLGYNSASFGTLGGGPMQGIHNDEGFVLPFDVSFQHHVVDVNPGMDIHNTLLYLGPHHYSDHNVWFSYASLWIDDNPDYVWGRLDIGEDFTYEWPLDWGHADEQYGQEYPASAVEAQMPWIIRVQVDDVGIRGRTWRADLPEPTEWGSRYYWLGGPPPQDWFRYIYLETQAFNSPYIGNPQPTLKIDWFKFCPFV